MGAAITATRREVCDDRSIYHVGSGNRENQAINSQTTTGNKTALTGATMSLSECWAIACFWRRLSPMGCGSWTWEQGQV